MEITTRRADNRRCNQLRELHVTYNIFEFAGGSVLFELGKTKVLCAVTIQPGVPPFLKGKKLGWLTAEYAMLPASTQLRSARESEAGRRNGRSVEISRFIGRSLRAVVDVTKLGERTIIVDCDVLQADGGTRTACITAAGLALEAAQRQWQENGVIVAPIMTNGIVALSVGLRKGIPLVDLDFEEDSSIDADFNIVFTRSGSLIEIQGSAERCPYTLEQFAQVQLVAVEAAQQIIAQCYPAASTTKVTPVDEYQKEVKIPFFSLQNRSQIG
jgi:ribonuclease PH